MPTQHQRIAVTRTPDLDRALREVAPLVPPNRGTATVVRELAVEGAAALLRRRESRKRALEQLAERSVSEDLLNWKALERTDEYGWVSPGEAV